MTTSKRDKNTPAGWLLEGAEVITGGRSLGRVPVLVQGRRVAVVGSGARRSARGASAGTVRRVDLEGSILSPGFVDLHTHGAAGVDFVEASGEEVARAMDHYLAHGVTRILMSLYPSSWKKSLRVVEHLADVLDAGHGRGVVFGLHLEGPFVSPTRPGALPVSNFRAPSTKDAAKLLEAARGYARTVTLAPELRGAPALTRFFERHGVVPAFGHSDADYDQTCRAVDAGLHYATHLFNAMNGLHHRDPGAVTALIEHPEVAVELISDGEHVHPSAMRLVTRAKPSDKVVLVSDSVPPCGLRDGRYDFAGGHVELRKGRITRDDGRLAGSALTMDRAVRVQVRDVGTSLPDALRYASENPARVAQISRRAGVIARGRPADLVALDASKLTVRATWLGGRLVHARGRL